MKKIITLIVIVLAVVLIIVACTSGEDEEKNTSPTSDTKNEQEADTPDMTTAQENAYEAAKNYIDTLAFSKKGLMQQLTSEYEGYKKKDARFAIELLEKNGEVNWKDEAVEAAQNYLDTQSFSKDGLYEQLVSEYGEGFTKKQARYAVDKVYK